MSQNPPPPPAYPGPSDPGSQGPASEASGFFSALFDFGFNSFVTPRIVKVV